MVDPPRSHRKKRSVEDKQTDFPNTESLGAERKGNPSHIPWGEQVVKGPMQWNERHAFSRQWLEEVDILNLMCGVLVTALSQQRIDCNLMAAMLTDVWLSVTDSLSDTNRSTRIQRAMTIIVLSNDSGSGAVLRKLIGSRVHSTQTERTGRNYSQKTSLKRNRLFMSVSLENSPWSTVVPVEKWVMLIATLMSIRDRGRADCFLWRRRRKKLNIALAYLWVRQWETIYLKVQS